MSPRTPYSDNASCCSCGHNLALCRDISFKSLCSMLWFYHWLISDPGLELSHTSGWTSITTKKNPSKRKGKVDTSYWASYGSSTTEPQQIPGFKTIRRNRVLPAAGYCWQPLWVTLLRSKTDIKTQQCFLQPSSIRSLNAGAEQSPPGQSTHSSPPLA